MTSPELSAVLAELDVERRAAGERDPVGSLHREWAHDRSACRIVFSALGEDAMGDTVRTEVAAAQAGAYTLEWKTYSHDAATALPAHLERAGFCPGDAEQVLMATLDDRTLGAFPASDADVRRVSDDAGLADYEEIALRLKRDDPAEERAQLAAVLARAPESLGVHIAYQDGRPVSCGRIHYTAGSTFGELAGGRTVPSHRRRGLFTAVVAARLTEARSRGCERVLTDALPTSEPILRRRGFTPVTSTRPYIFDPTNPHPGGSG